MEEQSEEEKKQQAKKISIYEGCSASVMEGFGQRYITPYAIALGSTNTIIGLLSSLPNLLGSISKIFSIKLIEKNSRKKILFWSSFIQAILWLPLILAGYLYFFKGFSAMSASILLLIIYTLITVVGAIAAPAWNSWIRDLLSNDVESFFGRRNKIISIAVLISALVAGGILQFFNNRSLFLGFTIIFLIALLGRSVSTYLLKKQYEPKFTKSDNYYFSFLQFIKKMKDNNFGRFTLFVSMLIFGVAIAGPFFPVYMLKNLSFNYITFTFISVLPLISSIIFMPFWSKFIDNKGNVAAFRVCSSYIWAIPLLWFLTSLTINTPLQKLIIPYLIIVETLSGFFWAGFNLSLTTFIFHAVTKERIAICSAYSDVVISVSTLAGALLGGFISSIESNFLGITFFMWIFLISSAVRLSIILIMLPKIKEVREIEQDKKIETNKFENLLFKITNKQMNLMKKILGEIEFLKIKKI